jgi:plastocyanin
MCVRRNLGALLASAGLALSGWSSAAELQFQVISSAGLPIPDAVVYLTPSAATPHSPPAKPVIIDQVNRQFVPRVSVIQVGTRVSFPNGDNIRHSVYSFSPSNKFTLKLYAGTPTRPVVFDNAGVVVLGCNIHDSMIAWVLVLDTPYHAPTDQSGTAKLDNVPPGDYRLRAWHEPMSSEQPGEMIHVDAADVHVRKLVLDAAADMVETEH